MHSIFIKYKVTYECILERRKENVYGMIMIIIITIIAMLCRFFRLICQAPVYLEEVLLDVTVSEVGQGQGALLLFLMLLMLLLLLLMMLLMLLLLMLLLMLLCFENILCRCERRRMVCVPGRRGGPCGSLTFDN